MDEQAHADLARWLAAAPEHRDAFQKAGRLWLLVGLVPPAHDLD